MNNSNKDNIAIPAILKNIPLRTIIILVGSLLIFLSASGQSALEAAAAGANVIFFQRDEDDEYLALLERVGVKNIGFFDEKRLQEALLNILEPKRALLENLSIKRAAQEITALL